MNILKKFWNWLAQPEQVHQPVVEDTKPTCCGNCDCAPTLTQPSASVTEFYQNEEGYAKAAYAEVEDTPVIATPVPSQKKTTRKKPASAITAKKTPTKKPTPSKKVPPQKKPAPKKK